MNLVKWFRKNNKKVMAVVVIVIMVGFIGGSALQRLLMGGRTELHKTVAYFGDNRKITNEDLLAAYRELQVLRMLQTDTALRSIQEPIIRTPDLQAFLLGELLFSDRRLAPLLISRIRQIVRANRYRISDKQINDIYRRPMPDNIYWLLLKNEAELAGIRVPNEHAGKWLARNIPQLTRGATYSLIIRPIVDRQGVPEDEILTTFSRLLGVLEYARMVCSGEDTTGQQVMHGISQEGETIDVEFVRFDSSVFAEAQDEPMEQEILAHFDKHKRFFAGEVSEENPRGFGYKLAGRVQLEYIAVKLDDISGIVATPTQEEAEEYYLRNREQFTVSVTPDPNDPDSPTERTQSYAEVAAEIPNLLLQKRIDTKAAQILQEAKGLTEAGLEGGDAEAANLSIEELEATAGDYETAAEELSKKYKVKVYAGRTGLLNAVDMQADKHLGRLYVRGQGETLVGLVRIVFAMDELGSSELGPFDAPKPRMYENIGPTRDVTGQITKDITGQIMAVVRVIKAEKACEPESINQTFSKSGLDLEQASEEDPNRNEEAEGAEDIYSVKEKVVEDLKKLAAMDTTRNKAEEFIKQGTEDGWEDAIDKFNELYGEAEEDEGDPNAEPPEPADGARKPFRLQNLTNLQRVSSTSLGTLAVRNVGNPAGRSRIDMAKKESKLLEQLYSLVPQDSNTVEKVPFVVEFEPDMSCYVIKNISVRRINRNEYETMKTLQAYREELVQSQSLAAIHFNPENILARMDFRQVEEDEEATDANTPAETEEAS